MGAPKPHLAFYCPGTGTGGPWRYVHSLLGGLDPDEFDVTVFCDLPGAYEPRPWVRVIRLGGPDSFPGGAPVGAPPAHARAPYRGPALARLAPPAVRLWAGFGTQVRRLARLFRRTPVDLLHTQNTGCEESPVAAKLAGARCVVGTFHVDPTYDLHNERSGPSHRVLELVSNRCLDAAIAVSRATKRDWVRRSHIPADRVITIHNGIDPDTFRRRQTRADARRALGLPADGLIVGGLGRLEEAKGFTYLLAAAARLRAEFPDLTVVIAGAGPLRESLERQASQLGPVGSVRFLGFRSDVQPVLDALDVFALPSLCETLGYALLEAMATELPAVGSAVGGVPEVIAAGETGFVVPPRDAALLAERLRVLLKDRTVRDRWGAAGRHRVARDFHERDMVRKTIDVYRVRVARRKETR
ncbi:glycosyltransferase [Frigoriglobus tundricola]|uniref:GT4 family glycosyltransferase n=1 Tax=Frigoriglobus tundricola TaxID=2774151 RepID=A0A6M5YXE7_9BACT|nr:glycosyltransferase [Frigoriglobus tundricola]QJW98056.1 GT4 family glycosyltransferase [Frigoriglobus tundricola]